MSVDAHASKEHFLVDEEWRPVVGFESYYEVSNLGRLRSLDRTNTSPRFGARRTFPGRLRRLTPHDRTGHPRAILYGDDENKAAYVHRLVLAAFVGPCPTGMEGCHNDGNPANNCLTNLRWDTPSSNGYDRIRHGRDWQLKKTHCPQGHPFSGDNLHVSVRANGQRSRQCRTCLRAQSRAKHERKRRAAEASQAQAS